MALLEIESLDVFHGQLPAVVDLSLTVAEGEVVAVIGANGAGKSTLLRAIMGLLPVKRGAVRFDRQDLTRVPPFKRTRTGIAMVPEGRRLFSSLTLEENLLTGGFRGRTGPWSSAKVMQLFDWMPERRRERVSHLSGGQQQAVAIGRALVSNPRLLLIDELSLGLAPIVARQVYGILPRIVAEGTSILLVDQDVAQSLAISQRVFCLLEGRKVLEGRPDELSMGQIETAYFGIGHAAGRG